MNSDYQQCSKCVMDSIGDSKIQFDERGVCNYCREFEKLKNALVVEGNAAKKMLEEKCQEIKLSGKNKQYDCILGLSGGVDSSYLALIAKQQGLKPLCIHFDNGWNSEMAVKNIENIVKKLGFDLTTFVINWEEFKDLQRAYLEAGVIDIEAITDHSIFASIYKLAFKSKIKYILSGSNVVTEGILPVHWTHRKSDFINIMDIHKKYGRIPIKTFPLIDKKTKRQIRKEKIETVELLNLLPYNKSKAKQILKDELDWQDYGGKHYESIFTKFYQAYILPTKFNVDKRKAHLSTLICSGQITKEEALIELELPLYIKTDFKNDKDYVLKKLGFSEVYFDQLMLKEPVPHDSFEVEGSLFYYYPVLKPLKPYWEFFKKTLNKKDIKLNCFN
jgi:N-acetyl sugar amidotransferase